MNHLLTGLLGVLLSTNAPANLNQLVAQTTGIQLKLPDPSDPVEKAYLKLLDEDDAAQTEVDKWIRDANAFEDQGAGPSRAALTLKIEQRLEEVRKAYDKFLLEHPGHVRARIAFGSYLGEIGDERGAVEQWEKARELEPANPAPWNNLANHFGHRGPIKKAFDYYARAIELDPHEPVYYQNLATSVYLFRKDAREHYGIDEQQVFDRALELYAKALKLDPANFPLATDLAQSYYGIKPPRYPAAIAAWEYALKIASDDFEREGVHIHLARFHINAGNFDQAREHLAKVKDERYNDLIERVTKTLVRKEGEAKGIPAPDADL